MFLVELQILSCLLNFLIVFGLFQIQSAFSGHIASRNHVELQLFLVVECGVNLYLNILVDAYLWIEHTLAYMEILLVALLILSFYQWYIKQIHLTEELLALFVEFAEFAHAFVYIDKCTIFGVERHGCKSVAEHVLILTGNLLVDTLFQNLVGVVSERCDDVAWLSIFVFHYGMALNPAPIRILFCTSVITALQIAQVFLALAHQSHGLVKLTFLVIRQALHKLLVTQSLLWQHVAIIISHVLGLYVVFYHVVVTRFQSLCHQLVHVDGFLNSLLYLDAHHVAEQQDNDTCNDNRNKQNERHWRCIVVYILWVEPLVVYSLYVARLLQACIHIVDGMYQILVVSYDAQFA